MSREPNPCFPMLLLWVVLAAASPVAHPLCAQGIDPSHRILELPEYAATDPVTQFRMLKMLQNQFSTLPADDEGGLAQLLKQLDPEDLQSLQQMFSNMNLGAGGFPSLPAGLQAEDLEPLLREPNIQEMLEEYRRTGRLPPPNEALQDGHNWLPKLPGRSENMQRRDSSSERSADTGLRRQQPTGRSPTSAPLSLSQLKQLLQSNQLGNATRTQDDAPNIAEFFRRAQSDTDALPELPELDAIERQLSGTPAATGRGVSNETVKQNLKSWVPEKLAQRLDRNGIKNTLSHLLREAKGEVKAEGAGGTPIGSVESSGSGRGSSSEGLQRSVMKALDGLRGEIVDIAKQVPKNTRKNSSESVASTTTTPPVIRPSAVQPSGATPGSATVASGSSADKIDKKASSFFSNWLKTPDQKQDASRDAKQGGLPPAGETSILSLEVVVLCFLAAALAWWLWPRAGGLQSRRRLKLAVDVPPIASDEDVVRAYHQLSHRLVSAEAWWTPHHSATVIQRTEPAVSGAVQTLLPLYEAVRYRGKANTLSPEELALANRVVAGLSTQLADPAAPTKRSRGAASQDISHGSSSAV